MSAITVDVTIVSTGVAQSVAKTCLPALPSVVMGGVSYPSGSATQTPSEIIFTPGSANAASVLIRAGVGGGIPREAAGPDYYVRPQGSVTLDDFSVIGTAGDIVHVMIIG